MSRKTKFSNNWKKATIPEAVRRVMGLRAGDVIAFDVEGNEIRIRKASPVDLAFVQALETTLTEWTSEADEDAYREL
jgi:bifunctional DNA-binding transcriptional regulator/antitoxin component of YhaV-PrlF toxin-antitoxin module